MSLFENDIVLPGVITEILSDYGSEYDTSLFGTTDSVVVIGTAFNGPVGTPIKIYSPEHAQYVFGGVYDSKTRKEANLVANIKDAWDRGCRTIYAVRLSGKEIYKDYQFAVDTNLKLRVSGLFPSNLNKSIYLVYDDNSYEMSIKIYKPANRATIAEKKRGLVENQDAIMINKIDLYNGGLTKEDDLLELIDRVNNYTYNNVLKLSIVDENGNDVTLSSMDAKALKIGDMFPGLYTIGRSCNADGILSDTKMDVVLDGVPYKGFDGAFYKKLSLNTNVSLDLPIYSSDDNLHTLLGISALDQYSFLATAGKIDEIFLKDSIDYEEVALSDFEIYKRLGSGYAINSQIVEVADGKFKVKEVTDKATKKTEIKDGIYSALESFPARYRVLAGLSADTVIKGKLPKAKDFKFANAKAVKMFDKTIEVKANINKNELTEPKKYSIAFKTLEDSDINMIKGVKNSLYTKAIAREATLMTSSDLQNAIANKKVYNEGSLFLVTNETSSEYPDAVNLLYTYSNGKFTSLHKFKNNRETDFLKGDLIFADGNLYVCSNEVTNVVNSTLSCTTFVQAETATVEGKENIIVSLSNGTFVIAHIETITSSEDSAILANENGLNVSILGTMSSILANETDNDDILVVSLSSSYNENKIVIKSNQFDYLTIDEVVDILNEDVDFAKLFTVKTLDITKAQEFIDDLKDQPNIELTAELFDKELTYDTTLLIPFRTEDNFGRHLAQHCMSTSLKTTPTHGFIGVKLLLDMSLDSVANKVDELVDLRLDSKMIGKKGNGTDILDNNNMPYPIGRKVSVIVGQYKVVTDDNYSYVSNMAAGYAGMVSVLSLDQSSTCQTINIPTPMYEFTNYQLSSLTEAGFVTVKNSYSKDYVITDGVTMATPESPHRRLSASRIGDAVEDLVRGVGEPFIGKQNNLSNQNSLKTAIKSALDKIVGTLIESYDFKLIVDSTDAQLGIINVDLRIIPIYEIKQIVNSIKIKS